MQNVKNLNCKRSVDITINGYIIFSVATLHKPRNGTIKCKLSPIQRENEFLRPLTEHNMRMKY